MPEPSILLLGLHLLLNLQASPLSSPVDLGVVLRDADLIVVGRVLRVEGNEKSRPPLTGPWEDLEYSCQLRTVEVIRGRAGKEITVRRHGDFWQLFPEPIEKDTVLLAFLMKKNQHFEAISTGQGRYISLFALGKEYQPSQAPGPERIRDKVERVLCKTIQDLRLPFTQCSSAVQMLFSMRTKYAEDCLKSLFSHSDPAVVAAGYYGLVKREEGRYLADFVEWYFSKAEEYEADDNSRGLTYVYLSMALSDVSDVKQMGTLEKALSYPLSANLDLYPFGEVTDPAWIPLLVKVLDHKSRTVRVRAAAALARFTGYFERQLGGCHSTEDEEKVIQFWKEWWSSGKGREFMEKSKKRGADERVIQIPPPPSDSTGGAPDRPAPGPSPDGTSGGSAPPSRPPGTTED